MDETKSAQRKSAEESKMNAKRVNLARKEITEQMRGILAPWVSDVDLLDKMTEETNLMADLGLDSIGILQVILGAEKVFGITIKDQELDSDTFSMMGNLVSMIHRRMHEDN
ncbi:MAG: acyl carrier protein [Planctomycetota bacterium]